MTDLQTRINRHLIQLASHQRETNKLLRESLEALKEIELLKARVEPTGKHDWECRPGVWESDYCCKRCGKKHQERHDVATDTEPPEFGCEGGTA